MQSQIDKHRHLDKIMSRRWSLIWKRRGNREREKVREWIRRDSVGEKVTGIETFSSLHFSTHLISYVWHLMIADWLIDSLADWLPDWLTYLSHEITPGYQVPLPLRSPSTRVPWYNDVMMMMIIIVMMIIIIIIIVKTERYEILRARKERWKVGKKVVKNEARKQRWKGGWKEAKR